MTNDDLPLGWWICWNQTNGIHALNVTRDRQAQGSACFFTLDWIKCGMWDLLTLQRVHGCSGESPLLGVVRDQLCHPPGPLGMISALDQRYGSNRGRWGKPYAMINGTQLGPMLATMYKGARCRKGPKTGVTARSVKTTMPIKLENMITGHRRPRRGPSDTQTAIREYAATNAFPMVGYSF